MEHEQLAVGVEVAMDWIEQVLDGLPLAEVAGRADAEPSIAAALAPRLVGALIAGMAANTDRPRGERSLADALRRHAARQPTVSAVDAGEGLAIVRNVFGANTDAVAHTLAREFADGDLGLVRRLLALLAPLVLARLGSELTTGSDMDRLGPILTGFGATQHGRGAGRRGRAPGLSDLLLESGQQGSATSSPEAGPGSLDESIQTLSGLLGEGRCK